MIEEVRGPKEYDKIFNSSKRLFVKFYSNSCSPCKRLQPFLLDQSEKYKGRCKFIQVNVDKKDNDVICNTYKIEELPTMLFISSGDVKKIVVGADEDTIKEILKEVFGKKKGDKIVKKKSGKKPEKKIQKKEKKVKKKKKPVESDSTDETYKEDNNDSTDEPPPNIDSSDEERKLFNYSSD